MVQDEVDTLLRVGPQPASSLVFRRLLRYRHIHVAAPAYLAGAEALDVPADLTRHRLLGFTKWFDEATWTLSNGCRTERVPAKLWLGINDYAGVIRAAVPGMGVAEIPSLVCQREVSGGRLVPVLVDWCSTRWICPLTTLPDGTLHESWSCFSGIASRMPRRSHALWLRLSSHHVVRQRDARSGPVERPDHDTARSPAKNAFLSVRQRCVRKQGDWLGVWEGIRNHLVTAA